MGLTAKDVGFFMWKFFKVSIRSCYIVVKKYPLISCILLFLFLLHVVFPSVFWFLIYSSPVLVLAAVILRLYYFCPECQKAKNVKEDDGRKTHKNIKLCSRRSRKLRYTEDDLIVDKNESFSVHPFQTTRQRNVRGRSIEDYELIGTEDKDTVFSASYNNDLVDKKAVVEENTKDIREVKVDYVVTHADNPFFDDYKGLLPEFRDGSDERSQIFIGGGGETETENSEDTEDEEGAQRETTESLEWTKDDQKNIMDLGISEMERNKRLESLIAKRRARKTLSVQVRKTLINKGNPSLANDSGGLFSPTPGSAPSVLLPLKNPFDLPYDPYEEKPNLTGDSFHQEFMATHLRDTIYSRHKSFCIGSFSPGELKQGKHETMLSRCDLTAKQWPLQRPGHLGLKCQSDNKDFDPQIEQDEPQEDETVLTVSSVCNQDKHEDQPSEQLCTIDGIHNVENRNAFQVNGNDSSDGSNSSSSSDSSGPIYHVKKEEFLKSLTYSYSRNRTLFAEDKDLIHEPSCDSGSYAFEKRQLEDPFYFPDKGMQHTRAHSIASDLQVEVSEIGSPSLTTDGYNSSYDNILSLYDRGVEREIPCHSEEMLAPLSQVDENDSISRESYEVSEKDIEVGFAEAPNHASKNPTILHMLPDKVLTQDSMHKCASSPSNIDLAGGSHAYSTNGEIDDKTQPPVSSNSSGALSPDDLILAVPEMVLQSTEKLGAYPLHGSDFGKPKESREECNGNMNIIYNVQDCIDPTSISMEKLNSIKDVDMEIGLPMKQENARDLFESPDGNNFKVAEYTGDQLRNPNQQRMILESHKSVERKNVLQAVGNSEEVFEKFPEHIDMGENSGSIEDDNIMRVTQDREGEQGTGEIGALRIIPIFDDHKAPDMLQETVVDQIPVVLTSPSFLFQSRLSVDQVFLSDREILMDGQLSNTHILDSSTLMEQSSDNRAPDVPSKGQHMSEDSASNASCSGHSEKLREATDYLGKYSAETDNVNESMVSHKEVNLKPKIAEDEQQAVLDCTKPSNEYRSKSRTDSEDGLIKLVEAEGVTGPFLENEESGEVIANDLQKPTDAGDNLEAVKGDFTTEKIHAAFADHSNPEEEKGSSNLSHTEREDPSDPSPGRSKQEANSIFSVNKSAADMEDFNSAVGGTEGEQEETISPLAVLGLSESIETAKPKSSEDADGQSKATTEDSSKVRSKEAGNKSAEVEDLKSACRSPEGGSSKDVRLEVAKSISVEDADGKPLIPTEVDSLISSKQSGEEANTISDVNRSAAEGKNLNSTDRITESGSEELIEQQVVTALSDGIELVKPRTTEEADGKAKAPADIESTVSSIQAEKEMETQETNR